ncbi:hypothetical protein DPMN_131799 [Dreissena polymorpha]|uniref:Uncharacterized protein n=1 Tax=Dreissena polymorpha TaxID=45954 RepID=A0A9D4FSM2_DREPO|nr:hypothetical protein DPMN_131799 [Dreissena polymorpha]
MEVGDFQTRSGVRVVTVECNKNQQESIPHIISFGCGTRALITMRGRQPLCLYCQEVEHVRNTCPHNINAIFKEKQTEKSKTSVSELQSTAEIEPEVRKVPSTAPSSTSVPAKKQVASEIIEVESQPQEEEKGFKTVKSRKKTKDDKEKKYQKTRKFKIQKR